MASLIPGNDLPKVGWLHRLHFDKFVHACFYFIMCMLMYYSLVKEWKLLSTQFQVLIASSFTAVGIGFVIEILQSNLISGRYFDIFDVLANTIGVVIAVLIINLKN